MNKKLLLSMNIIQNIVALLKLLISLLQLQKRKNSLQLNKKEKRNNNNKKLNKIKIS
jgi:hypothetical protein